MNSNDPIIAALSPELIATSFTQAFSPVNPFKGKNPDDMLRAIYDRLGCGSGDNRVGKMGISSGWLFGDPQSLQRVSIFAGVHGNEISGIISFLSLFELCLKGRIKLDKGALQMVIANEEATRLDERISDLNMNRLFGDQTRREALARMGYKGGDCYTLRRVVELQKHLQSPRYHLDIHSTELASEPFLVCGEQSLAVARVLGEEKILLFPDHMSPISIDGITSRYFEKLNPNNIGITYESGQHSQKSGPIKALSLALRFSSMFTDISGAEDFLLPKATTPPEVYEIIAVEYREGDDFVYERGENIQSFQPYQPSERIGRSSKVEFMASDYLQNETCYLCLPALAQKRKNGDELFYVAKKRHK